MGAGVSPADHVVALARVPDPLVDRTAVDRDGGAAERALKGAVWAVPPALADHDPGPLRHSHRGRPKVLAREADPARTLAEALTRDAEVDAPLLLGALMHTQLVEQRRGAVHVLIE